MPNMLTVAEGFQSSVNIAYDLSDSNKLKSYIPTKSALDLLENILQSTKADSTDRARILIGAYGKGKSHIVLMILSILMKKDLKLFKKMIPVIKEQRQDLFTLINSYYQHNDPILPVVVTGSGSSIEQSLMLALQNTLEENELQDIMPETNYQAAVNKIEDWKANYPGVYAQFEKIVDGNVPEFEGRLQDFDAEAYSAFEQVYPSLTAGSTFNPFVGFNVTDIYSGVIKSLKARHYSGIYVVYDEFSKYIENHIRTGAENDTKTLQDFAEYCSRSGGSELHIMLISHKEITSYIGQASKESVDGWRGVSERFRHVYLNNNFTQTYEIIASAIQKNKTKWAEFEGGISSVLYDCYPLHPVSTFILPRLSERVAQNERTLFTFISASGNATLSSFLAEHGDDKFAVATPDLIYDYFEPLLKQEVYSGRLHKYHTLTENILRDLPAGSLEARIVKTIALIDILGQYEKLVPTMDEIVGIYSSIASPETVNKAIETLIEQKYVIYLKRSNGYLKLKETSGVDIRKSIDDLVAKRQNKADTKKILNGANFDSYMYPSRYNDEKEMTRYFKFEFISSSEASDDTDWKIKRGLIHADGAVFAIIPESSDDIELVLKSVMTTSKGCQDCVFVIPRKYSDIEQTVCEFEAVRMLMDTAAEDRVLYDDYEIVYDDLQEVIRSYIGVYTHPEKNGAYFVYNGEIRNIRRKSELSGLLSDICDELYWLTPAVNNEVINKEDITSIARNSRSKIVAGLLRAKLEPSLGLKGSGQEVSVMRSTLVMTGILQNYETECSISLEPEDQAMREVLNVIRDFVLSARAGDSVPFEKLYSQLTMPEYHIGMRKGLIPIYLAAVFHEYLMQIVLRDRNGQIPTNADALEQINADPSLFSLSFINWDADKEQYVCGLAKAFCGSSEGYDSNDVSDAMRKWYMLLPKYAKNLKALPDSAKVSADMSALMSVLRRNECGYDFLFKRLPESLRAEKADSALAERIAKAKLSFDRSLDGLKEYLSGWMREQFGTKEAAQYNKMSLSSIVKDWCEKIDPEAFNQLFPDGTSQMLSLMKDIGNDEDSFVEKIGRAATDLRIEDWDSEVIGMFKENMLRYRKTAEAFHSVSDEGLKSAPSSGYTVSFAGENGQTFVRHFDKVNTSARGRLLFNSLMDSLDSMGQSISEAEKRQILMNVLAKFC